MRLGSVTLSATLSAVLLSGCSFIGGQPTKYENPYAKQKAASQGHYGQHAYGQPTAGQHCQIASPRQPIPRGCRPEQVTIGTSAHGQYQGGFAQQPQFGQPQYTDGGYGSAVGQNRQMAHHAPGPRKSKPKLRGSLSLGVERSVGGELLEYGIRDDIDIRSGYNPQLYNEQFDSGSQSGGSTTEVLYTANDFLEAGSVTSANIRRDNEIESFSQPAISFDDVWSTPASLKAGLEYIIDDKTTVFANGGYSYSEGNSGNVASVTATLYRDEVTQAWTPQLDAAGEEIPGAFVADGNPTGGISFLPNQQIATFAYDFSDLERYDLEVGARRYFNPIIKSEGFRTVTPFVGASVGASHVNAVEFKSTQTQVYYQRAFEGGDGDATYIVPTADTTTRLYDSQWLPQGQLNLGAEWQVTPGFAVAAETGVRFQGGRKYSDFTNAAGDLVEGRKGDLNVSVPVTLRGSINF